MTAAPITPYTTLVFQYFEMAEQADAVARAKSTWIFCRYYILTVWLNVLFRSLIVCEEILRNSAIYFFFIWGHFFLPFHCSTLQLTSDTPC